MLTLSTLIQQLVRATLPQTRSLLPNDIKITVEILTIIIEILENNYNDSDINEVSCIIHVYVTCYCSNLLSLQVLDGTIDVVNNLLYDSNREGWRVLQTVRDIKYLRA